PENFRRATDARTRCYYAETLPNPKLEVFPIGEVAKIGRELGGPLIVDNTAAPVLCRPLDHGAAVVMYSTTKYIGGHGSSIGGVGIEGGHLPAAPEHSTQHVLHTPRPQRNNAGPQLSGRVLGGGGKASGSDRLHPADARGAAARPRRVDEPV